MALTKVSYAMIQGASLNVLDYGAIGDGSTNDTAAIQSAIDALGANDQLYFPAGFDFAVTKLEFDGIDDFSVLVEGKITNIAAKAGAAATNTNSTQRGLFATFYINNCNRFSITGSGQINNGYREAFYVGLDSSGNSQPCADFRISVDIIGNATNDNIHCNVFRYCTNFSLFDMNVTETGKKPAYVNNSTAYYYNWVEQFLFWDCSNFTLDNVTSTYSAMNGAYIGSNCTQFTICNCNFQHNAASGIQLAWSSFGTFPSSFNINGNRTEFNRADGIDVNNTDTLPVDLNGVIDGNTHYYNGWGAEDTAKTTPTNDGSGIGTFINVKKVAVTNNTTTENSRVGIYCSFAYDIIVSGNVINKSVYQAGGAGDGIYAARCLNATFSDNNVNVNVDNSTFTYYNDDITKGNVKVTNCYLYGNIGIAGGSYIDLSIENCSIISPAQVTVPCNFIGNSVVVTGSNQNGLYVNASGSVIERNRIVGTNYGLVSASFSYVKILNNSVIGVNGGIRVDTNNNTVISGNYASSTSAGVGIHLLGNSDQCEFSNNAAETASGNALQIANTCTNTNKWGNRAISGSTSYAGTFGINY